MASPMPRSRPTNACVASLCQAGRPSRRPLTFTRSSTAPIAAPPSSAKMARKPSRLRSKTSQATTAAAQKSAPPRVGVPSLARCVAGPYSATCWRMRPRTSRLRYAGYSSTPAPNARTNTTIACFIADPLCCSNRALWRDAPLVDDQLGDFLPHRRRQQRPEASDMVLLRVIEDDHHREPRVVHRHEADEGSDDIAAVDPVLGDAGGARLARDLPLVARDLGHEAFTAVIIDDADHHVGQGVRRIGADHPARLRNEW